MKSLYSKILVWFAATVALTFAGMGVIGRLLLPEPQRMAQIPARALLFYAEEAQRHLERDGPRALEDYFSRFRFTTNMELQLLDAGGRDVLTGEDRAAMLAATRRPRALPALRQGRFWVGHATLDRQYYLLLSLPPRMPEGPWFAPQQFWMVGCVLALCWALARYLTSPLRRLQRAVEAFGRGEFSARAGGHGEDELGQLNATFDRMAARIETLVTAERRLLADISHELRTPLTRLGVAVELARSGADPQASLDRIQREADRMNALVGDLLAVTRAEGDPARMKRTEIPLAALAEDVAAACALDAEAAGCRIETGLAAVPAVLGDPELLRRALENVVRNAIRYSPPEEAVRLELFAEARQAVLRIRDRGPGAAPESLPYLFDPFYRGHEGGAGASAGGYGLGLNIARRAVELHGGAIRARNAAPGLEVEIRLPAA